MSHYIHYVLVKQNVLTTRKSVTKQTTLYTLNIEYKISQSPTSALNEKSIGDHPAVGRETVESQGAFHLRSGLVKSAGVRHCQGDGNECSTTVGQRGSSLLMLRYNMHTTHRYKFSHVNYNPRHFCLSVPVGIFASVGKPSHRWSLFYVFRNVIHFDALTASFACQQHNK